MRRALVGLASLLVTLGSFWAATWVIGSVQGPEPSRAPALTRAEPQPVSSAPPIFQERPPEAPAPRLTRDFAARQARVAAAAEEAEEAARQQVVAAAQAGDEPLGVRLALYLASLRDALEASGDSMLLAQRSVWTEHFLRLEPVQAELASLAPGARGLALARIRSEMGFGEEEIAYLAERDAVREGRWQRGLAYMSERSRLEESFQGAALDEELRALRERHFGHEALTIELEEADGFYRFERARIYGRN